MENIESTESIQIPEIRIDLSPLADVIEETEEVPDEEMIDDNAINNIQNTGIQVDKDDETSHSETLETQSTSDSSTKSDETVVNNPTQSLNKDQSPAIEENIIKNSEENIRKNPVEEATSTEVSSVQPSATVANPSNSRSQSLVSSSPTNVANHFSTTVANHPSASVANHPSTSAKEPKNHVVPRQHSGVSDKDVSTIHPQVIVIYFSFVDILFINLSSVIY